MILSYKYRLLPTAAQHASLARTLEEQRILYNAALEERISAYRCTGKGRSYQDQCRALTEWRRSDADAASAPANLQRWTLKRLDAAYVGFFGRVNKGAGRAGFPRFRSRSRWDSFGFAEFSGIRFDGRRLRWNTLPSGLRVHLHRSLPAGADIRSCNISRDPKGWSVSFQVALPTQERRIVETAVGLDLGLKVFAYQSDGVVVAPLRPSLAAKKELRRRSRALARCKRGSRNRRKAKARVARLHRRIANQRDTFLHQHSARIVKGYDLIAAEALVVRNMIRSPTLSGGIADAGWARFLGFLSYKAEGAGKTFVQVSPRNTSQMCSGCGVIVPKTLAVRTHSCPDCGLVIDRDWNASVNILQAVVGLGGHNVAQQGKRGRVNITAGAIPK